MDTEFIIHWPIPILMSQYFSYFFFNMLFSLEMWYGHSMADCAICSGLCPYAVDCAHVQWTVRMCSGLYPYAMYYNSHLPLKNNKNKYEKYTDGYKQTSDLWEVWLALLTCRVSQTLNNWKALAGTRKAFVVVGGIGIVMHKCCNLPVTVQRQQ